MITNNLSTLPWRDDPGWVHLLERGAVRDREIVALWWARADSAQFAAARRASMMQTGTNGAFARVVALASTALGNPWPVTRAWMHLLTDFAPLLPYTRPRINKYGIPIRPALIWAEQKNLYTVHDSMIEAAFTVAKTAAVDAAASDDPSARTPFCPYLLAVLDRFEGVTGPWQWAGGLSDEEAAVMLSTAAGRQAVTAMAALKDRVAPLPDLAPPHPLSLAPPYRSR